MQWNLVGAFRRNFPFGTEIAFKKGLERLGETVNTIDPCYPNQVFDEAADVTLVFKCIDPGPYLDALKRLGGIKIVYQPDDLRLSYIEQSMKEVAEYCQFALVFDSDGAKIASTLGYKIAEHLLLTADDTLYRRIPGIQKDIDVCFIGHFGPGPHHKSRTRMIEIVSKMKGIKFIAHMGLYDIAKLNEIYNRSKIVLNHATDVGQAFGTGYGYQCRHFEAGFTGACVLTNKVLNNDIIKNIVCFESENSLVENIRFLIQNTSERVGWGEGLYEEMIGSHKPEHRAQQLIDFVKRAQCV